MTLGFGIFMASHTIDGQLISLLRGDEISLPQDLSPRTMNNISPQIILNPYGNVPCLQIGQRLTVDCVAVGSALVAHFSYYWQNEIGDRTDVLDRYKALVIDRVGSDLLQYYD